MGLHGCQQLGQRYLVPAVSGCSLHKFSCKVSSMTSTQNPGPKTIIYLFTPEVSVNLPALTPIRGTMCLNRLWAASIYLESPGTKQCTVESIWLIINSNLLQPYGWRLLALKSHFHSCYLADAEKGNLWQSSQGDSLAAVSG